MRSAVLVLLAVALVACGDDDDVSSATSAAASRSSTSTSVSTSTSTTIVVAPTTSTQAVTTAPASVASTLAADAVVPEGFEQVAATTTAADGTVCELCLWLAGNGDQRALGLMHVTDLGGPDGMVFRYESPTTAGFWMKNTVMPLSIAFYDQDGTYLDAFDMQPCTADPCPTYPTPDNFTDAIEVPQGMLEELGMTEASKLEVTNLPCSRA